MFPSDKYTGKRTKVGNAQTREKTNKQKSSGHSAVDVDHLAGALCARKHISLQALSCGGPLPCVGTWILLAPRARTGAFLVAPHMTVSAVNDESLKYKHQSQRL